MDKNKTIPVRQERMGMPVGHEWKNIPSRLMDEMGRILSRFSLWISPGMEPDRAFAPQVEISEDDKSIHVDAELPGVEQDDIDITLTRDTLTIRGEKKDESHIREEAICCTERSFGSFVRVIPLPEDVDVDKVEAVYRNGVLCINMLKIEGETSSKKVAIKNPEIQTH